MKIFYELFFYIFLGMLVLIGADSYLRYQDEVAQYEEDMIANAIQDGKSIAGMISSVWDDSGEKKALALIKDASEAGGIDITWIWLDDLSTRASNALEKNMLLDKMQIGDIVSVKRKNKNGSVRRYTYVPVEIQGERKGALELSQTLFLFNEFSHEMLLRTLIIAGIFAVFAGFILFLFINRKIRVPLNGLMQHAERIGQGDFSTDAVVKGGDEFTEMAVTMNDMCSRLLIAKEKIDFEYKARLRTLEQLRHTERLSTFGLLSAEIAHEIGTPLNVVDGRAKMIMREDLTDDEIKDCATIIKSQAERMTLIIRQLLDFTRRPKQQTSTTNINLLLKQILQLLHPVASKQHVTFSLIKSDDVEAVLNCDGGQIQQVLINLLMNSVQAMPDGGKVHIDLTNSSQAENGKAMQQYLNIKIADEGEGISKEDLAHIFTPFFTTKKIGTGTGLGLSIAHGIVEEHGGWIEVESDSGSGTCFSIFLPTEELEI